MLFKHPILAIFTLFTAGFSGGCTSTSVYPQTAEYSATIQADRQSLQDHNEDTPTQLTLSINDALKIAVRENLDARVAAFEYLVTQKEVTLENLKALPSMTYTLTRHGRSNQPASSSLSILTGQQSLEPSVSQEKFRSTRDIAVNWNIIDAASALVSAKNASNHAQIAKERYQKVVQNIHRDVYAAYWNALSDQREHENTQTLIAQVQDHMKKLDLAAQQKLISTTQRNQQKQPFIQAISNLQTLNSDAELASIELKSLLNVPQSTAITLASEPKNPAPMLDTVLNKDIETLEITALENRPEMHEAFIDKNISIRETKEEIIRTLPGAELFYALNQDTNKFLVNGAWKTYSLNLVQNITSLISFPDRYLAARRNEDLSEARRITLAAAIIAQVHISRHGLIHAKDQYHMAMYEQKSAQDQAFTTRQRQNVGNGAKGDTLLAALQAQEKNLSAYQAMANFQESFATFMNTLGIEVGDTIKLSSKAEELS